MGFLKFHPSFSGKRDSGENLKKVLALVLAFACAFTMFAGAAFTDSADIKVDTEVVDTLVSLGVVNGYDDGSFKPNGTVTRAEMAKMIYVLRTGNSDASAYNDDKTSFTDIGSHWARGYIKYCQSLGIIAGKSNTKFVPNEKVSAQEAAKMLLVTLGYDAQKAGLVGTGWASKTNALADENGLLEDVNTSFTSACPRQYAAQLIYNTIFAHTVTLRDGEYTNMNLLGTDKLETVGEKYMGLKKWIGTFDGNADSLGIDDGQIQVTGTLDGKEADKDHPEASAHFKASLDLKYVGEEVSVLFKDVTGGTTNQPDKKDNIYGVYVTGTTKVINATLDDVDDKTDGKKIKVDGTKYEVAALDEGDEYVVNNLGAAKALTVPKASANDAEKSAKLFAALGTQSGAPIKFVCNDNGKIVKAYVTTSTINKVNATTSTKVTLNSIGGLEKEDNYIYDGAKKDDIVVATKQFSDAKYTVVKAETVTGVLKGFVKKTVNQKDVFTKVTIDGTVYKIDNEKLNKLNDDCVDKLEDSDIDSQVTAYLINGMVGALEVEEGASNWAVVNDFNGNTNLETSFNSAEVELITADGKTISGKVHKDSESKKGTDINVKNDLTVGNLVKYVQTSDSVIKIKEVSDKTVTVNQGAIIYNKDTKSLSTKADATTSMVVASDAPAYITNSDEDIKVYKLRDLKTITAKAATKVNYVVDDGKVIAAYIELNARPTGSAADTVYGEVTAANGTKKVDGDYYSEYVVTCNDTPYTVYTNQSLEKKQIVSFDPTSDNIYDNGDIIVYKKGRTDAKAVWVDEYDAAETLTYYTVAPTKVDGVFKGDDTKLTTDAVDDDVVVAYVDLDDTDKAGENIGVDEFSATTGYANAVVVYDTDGKTIVAIFVETSDKVDMASLFA